MLEKIPRYVRSDALMQHNDHAIRQHKVIHLTSLQIAYTPSNLLIVNDKARYKILYCSFKFKLTDLLQAPQLSFEHSLSSVSASSLGFSVLLFCCQHSIYFSWLFNSVQPMSNMTDWFNFRSFNVI